jgi:hypothetical protein
MQSLPWQTNNSRWPKPNVEAALGYKMNAQMPCDLSSADPWILRLMNSLTFSAFVTITE